MDKNGATDPTSLIDSTGGGLPKVARVRQHDGNNTSGGDNARNRTTNHPATASLRSRSSATRSQARAGQFRSNGGAYLQQVKSRLSAFKRGTLRRNRRLQLSTAERDRQAHRQFSLHSPDRPPLPGLDAQIHSEQVSVNRLVDELYEGGYGFVEGRKPSDVVRLMGNNANSLSLFDDSRSWKVDKIKEINQRYQTDGFLLQECGTDFRYLSEDQSFGARFGDSDCRYIAANNITENTGRSQYGGVAALNFPRLAGFTTGTGKDPTGLARWVYTYVGTGRRRTRIVTAYRPVKPARSLRNGGRRGWHTVWSQHRRYIRKNGLGNISPHALFARDLVRQLLEWKQGGDEIILFMDVNDHAYKGRLPLRLAERDLMMTEQFQAANGFEAPNSYYRGSRPITGCFCTQGIDCINIYVSPHRAGAGDHRYWIMDFDAQSVLGAGYPHLVRPKGRRLKCVVKRTRVAYLRRLRKLTERHKMYSKMQSIQDSVGQVPPRELKIKMNKWDQENVEHKLAAEEGCNQYKNDFLEFSPETNVWIKRRDLYTQLRSINARLEQGKRADITHFARACAVSDIVDPFSLSDQEIGLRIEACKARLRELKSVAPLLRLEHLRACITRAKERGDTKAVIRIRQIIRNEKLRKRWSGVKRATNSRRGGAPTSIRVQSESGDQQFNTQDEVEEQASRRLTSRFQLARDAPICNDALFDEFGYLGDTASTRAILEGTYEYPPEMDWHTRLLCEEAHRIFTLKSTEEISNYVATEDFQYFWLHCDEFIQSSYSHVHFGHYKAIAHDRYLSALEAAKLSLAAQTGIPMDRWGSALTVLLEKEFGNIYLEKMRAICLLEADFNWLNKLIFAKRMMDQAYDNGMVPVEQFARRGTQATSGVLTKVLFCDMIRALHEMAGIPSVDLGNCYDAVAHPIASIALQAFQVPLVTVALSLSVLQTMTFFLRTGYGVSQVGYGGSTLDPTFGLGQGNGMAPSGFSAVSSLMVGALERLGHASSFAGAWTGILFCLAAVIYVDDTDLLIRASSRDLTIADFYDQCQSAVTDWGRIVLATGGYLKASKCFWYMMAWKWHKGVPSLRSLNQLPNYKLYIPQKSGVDAAVPLRCVTVAEETLGVWSCPSGDFGVHVSKKMEKGHLWVERLRRNRCPAADGWLGFRYSLMPKMTYGFAAITIPPDELEKSFQALYREVLSPLRVNKNITLFYRMAPKRVMGLGMPNPCIRMLAHKLHLLQSEWNQPTTAGQMLRQSLEVFQMETGFSENVLEMDYDRYELLATGGWWKQFWCLSQRYGVNLRLGRKWIIPLTRVNDRALMDIICSSDLFSCSDWTAINRVRKFKGIHSVADFVLCDGRTVDPWVFTSEPSDSSRVFSIERPTRSDFALFRRAVEFVTSATHRLPTALGQFVASPHRRDVWFTNTDRSHLFQVTGESSYREFSPPPGTRATRHGTTFSSPIDRTGQCPRLIRASVCALDSPGTQVLHSTAPVFVPPVHRRSFLDRIRLLTNQSLWKSLTVDGDGSWIYNGLLNNTLVMMSDGSYDENSANDVCSCAAAIECSTTGQRATVTWVEKSDSYTADNYRAEVLGGIAIQLILRVACEGKYISPSMRPRIGCDNNGVVHHGNHPWRPITANQAQADVLRYYKQLVREQPFKCKMYHVHGHIDKLIHYEDMTPAERLNCDCDKLAGTALHDALTAGTFISRHLPDEDLVVLLDGEKVTGSYEKTITRSWGDKQARLHYHEMGIIPLDLFNEVYWDGVEKVLGRCPEMFSVWAAKQVSGFCGNNHLLHHINGVTVDVCPNCGCHPERASHIIFCRDTARSNVFNASVDRLVEWLASQRTDAELTIILSTYLRGRGDHLMSSLCSRKSRYYQLACMVDALGFRNMMEGRIPKLFYSVRVDDILRRRLRKHAGHWCNGLILQLLQITHRQWTFRNGTVHLKGPDGLTEAQQGFLSRRCEALLWTDPSTLLAEDRYLLDVDFDALADGPASERQTWLSEVDAARCAARYADADYTDTILDAPDPLLAPPIDTEGSIRFRRRRRRRSGVIEHIDCSISQIG